MTDNETLVGCPKCGCACVIEKLLAELAEEYGFECDECQQKAADAK